jgi:short-subunit dehydrogenase
MDIKGKYAFITGSSRGVGQQIALGLADKGCHLILHGRTKESCDTTLNLLDDKKVKVFTVYGDLAIEAGVLNIIKQVQQLDVPVSILYNNAAIMTAYRKDYWQHSWDDWMESMKVNVFAVYTLCSAFIPAMLEQKYGRVINLVSGIEKEPELAPYASSKWALIKLTEDLASKYDNTPVRINMLDPGWLRTDLGGKFAHNAVEDVLPGALLPALLKNDGLNGALFRALYQVV